MSYVKVLHSAKFVGPMPELVKAMTINEVTPEMIERNSGGFWIGPDGLLYEVPREGHYLVAKYLVDDSYHMRAAGFIHLSFCCSTYDADWWQTPVTAAALRALLDLSYYYEGKFFGINLYENDRDTYQNLFQTRAHSREGWEQVREELRDHIRKLTRLKNERAQRAA